MVQPSTYNYLLSVGVEIGQSIESLNQKAGLERLRIISALFESGCFRLGDFEIEKGRVSPYALCPDSGLLTSGILLNQIARLFTKRITGIHSGPDFIISPSERTLHLASAAAMSLTAYRKKEISFCSLSTAGGHSLPQLEGKSVIIVDMMAITGNELFQAIDKVEELKGRVDRVVTVYDPDEKRGKNTPFSVSQSLYMRDIHFHSLTHFGDLVKYLSDPGVNKNEDLKAIETYRKTWGAKKDLSAAAGNVGYCY